jgi:CheY-like chemotaxis protein
MRVLIVEDDPEITSFLATALGLEGHSVRSACNGREALGAIRESRPDLIVLDLWMPVMNGWEFMSELRCSDDPAERNIPVIGISADAQASTRDLDFSAFFVKPIDVPGLLASASNAAGGAA